MADTEFIRVGGRDGVRDLTDAKGADPPGLGLTAGKSYKIQNGDEAQPIFWRITANALAGAQLAALDGSREGFMLDPRLIMPADRETIALDANEHLYFYGPYAVQIAVQNA